MKKFIFTAVLLFAALSTTVIYGADTLQKTRSEIFQSGEAVNQIFYDSDGNEIKTAPADVPALYSDVPEKYDMRTDAPNMFTETVNQGNSSACWAFGTLGSLESNMMKQGMITQGEKPYLSVAKLGWYARSDKTRNAEGPVSDNPLQTGGNSFYATAALANGISDTEENVPFCEYLQGRMAYTGGGGEDAKVVQLKDVYQYTSDEQYLIKQAVMENGGVSAAYYDSHEYYSENDAYYQNEYTSINHVVMIVGWDDNYAVENFNENCRPDEPGAWIIRNSWGSGSGDNGFYYLSYYDTSLMDFASFVADNEILDNTYSYTNSTYSGLMAFKPNDDNTASAEIANVFTAKGNESLKKIGVSTYNNNVVGKVKVYKNVADGSADGELCGETEFYFPVSGFHTIDLDTPVELSKGEKFSVEIQFIVGYENLYIPVEMDYESDSITAIYNSNLGESYCKKDGKWLNLSEVNSIYHNAYIWAYTDNDDDAEETAKYKTLLQDVISQYENTDSSPYSAYLWQRLEKAVEANKDALNSSDLQTVKNAYARINEAYLGLMKTDEISSMEDLVSITQQLMDCTYFNTDVVFTNDITLTGTEVVFANYSYYYMLGTDGRGHTVTIGDDLSYTPGLFAGVYDTTIKNLNVKCNISSENYVAGGIAGAIKDSVIDNCTVSGSITLADGSSEGTIGGITAYARGNSKITNCINYADVTADLSQSGGEVVSGGIAGYVTGTTDVEKCLNFGSVSGNGIAGGIAGKCDDGWTFTDCGNNGAVTSAGTADAIACGNSLTFTDCYNNSASAMQADTMNNCYDLNSGVSAKSFENGEVAYLLNTTGKESNSGIWTVKDGKTVFADDETGAVSAINITTGDNQYKIYAPYNKAAELPAGVYVTDSEGNRTAAVGARDNLEDVTITAEECLKGDANLDGKVTADDAALTLQYVLMGKGVEPDGIWNVKAVKPSDETITSENAALILQKSLDDTFLFPQG